MTPEEIREIAQLALSRPVQEVQHIQQVESASSSSSPSSRPFQYEQQTEWDDEAPLSQLDAQEYGLDYEEEEDPGTFIEPTPTQDQDFY